MERPEASALEVRLRTGATVGAETIMDPEAIAGAETIAAPETALPLVLVPGVAGSRALFAGLLPPLAAGRRVAAVDLSPRVAPGAAVADSAAEDLRETLDELGLRRVDLLGQSFGALVSVRFARAHPERTRRLVLAAPATVPAGAAGLGALARWALVGAAVRWWPARSGAGLERWVRRAGGYPIEPEVGGEALTALAERVRRTRVRPLVRRMLALARHSWPQELEGFAHPLLVIEGDREAALLPPAVLQYFRGRAGTRYAELPGGHMPFLVRPDAFARLVLEFLDAAEPAAHS